GKEGFEGNLWIEAGSYKTGRGGATLKGGGNKIKYRLSASGTRTDGISKADVRDGNNEKDGFTNFQFSGNLEVKVTKNFHLFATGRYGESDTEFDIFGLPTGVMDGDDNTKSKDYSFDSGAKFFTVGDKFSGNIGVQKSNLNRNNLSNGLPSFSSEGSRTKIYGNGVIRTGILDTILLGFESEKTETSGTFSTLTHQKVNALFGHIQDEILPSLTITFGLRYDSFSTEAPTSLSSNKITYVNASNRATNRTTLNYHFRNSDAILRASFGTGFKTPSIFQTTFFCCGAKEVNPNLKPETSKGWDIGIEKLLSDNTTFHLSYHWQSIENLIDFSFPDGGYLNISKAKTSGLEATINYARDVFHMGMNYTYSKAINVLLDSRLLRVPTHEIGLNIAYDISKVTSLGTSLIYRSDQLDINGKIEGAAVLDVRGSQRISEYLEFYARIENLLDQHYQTVFGYGTPGLSGYMGLRARF
ncbi:MAG: TonB-dependent receptor, partial [Sphingomonadales bacterium]